MRVFKLFIAVGGVFMLAAQGAAAHGISVSMTPSHFSGAHGSYKGAGRHWSRSTNATIIVNSAGAPGFAARSGDPDSTSYVEAPVRSDAERYREATGLSLPANHGTIVLPPATPKGDFTYIWPAHGND